MRAAVLYCTALLFALPHVLTASEAVPRLASGVTLILKFEEPVSRLLVESLNDETSQLLSDTGILIGHRLLTELTPDEQFENLVVVSFKGRCRIDARRTEPLRLGALAFTHRSDGDILPFVDVLCDQIRASIRPLMTGEQLRNWELVFGRAMGRVIAHELYHILARTGDHGTGGVAQHSLSGYQLMDAKLKFDREDLDKIQMSTVADGS